MKRNSNNLLSFVTLVWVASSTIPAHAEKIWIPVTDTSGPECPLKLSGIVECVQTYNASGQVNTRLTGEISHLNSGDTPLVAYAIEVHITPPLGLHKSIVVQSDCLFLDPHQLTAPGGTAADEIESEVNEQAGEKGADPRVEARLLWAEFADGSRYGSPTSAGETLASRDYLISRLDVLLRAYEREGETAFSEELFADLTNFHARPFIRNIRRIYEQDGIKQAIRAVETYRRNVELNMEAMQVSKR